MTPPVREPPSAAVHASRTDGLLRTAWLRSAAVATAAGTFLAVLGVRTAVHGGFPVRLGEMLMISWVATGMGVGIARVTQRLKWGRRPLVDAAIGAALMTAPMGLFVWGIDHLFGRPAAPLRDIPGYLYVSLVISTFMNLMVHLQVRGRTVVVHTLPPAPKFLERLPLKLRGAEVWAVEAEDHYLRLHTSKGQDLILMRLADAVAELEGIEGMQVHRSWWVARDAITDARRGDGRATLTLKDGAEVPVSRTYAAQLRERGWI
jgi:hypothetical protein